MFERYTQIKTVWIIGFSNTSIVRLLFSILTVTSLKKPDLYNFFKISFGKIDKCSKYVKQIQEKYNLADNINEADLYEFLIDHRDSDLLVKITNELTRYVPYRFIRPWFNQETRGLKDGLVNSKIIELQNESAPYVIDLSNNKIKINENENHDWLEHAATSEVPNTNQAQEHTLEGL